MFSCLVLEPNFVMSLFNIFNQEVFELCRIVVQIFMSMLCRFWLVQHLLCKWFVLMLSKCDLWSQCSMLCSASSSSSMCWVALNQWVIVIAIKNLYTSGIDEVRMHLRFFLSKFLSACFASNDIFAHMQVILGLHSECRSLIHSEQLMLLVNF